MRRAEASPESSRGPRPVSAARPVDPRCWRRSRSYRRACDDLARGYRPNFWDRASRSADCAGMLRAARRSRGVLPGLPGAAVQHRGERLENLAHLGRLVRKQLRRIHIVHDGGVVSLEYQQFTLLVFRAIDGEVVETNSIRQGGERGRMAAREAGLERVHERLFFETL